VTVEIYPAPTGAITSYTSRRYYVQCNGTPLFVYGTELTGTNLLNGAGPTLEPSFVRVGTSETVTFTVQKRVAGTATIIPITSVRVLARRGRATAEVVGGSARVVAVANTQMLVILNDDWANPLCLFADPLAQAIPVGAVDYTTLGSPTSIAPGSNIYFPPGVHVIGGTEVCPTGGTFLFGVGSNCQVYFAGGSIVVGNFKLTGATNVRFRGPGVQSGAFATWAAVQLLSFDQQVKYAPFYRSAFALTECSVTGVISTRNPFYGHWFGLSSFLNYHIVNPWFGNCDGLSAFSGVDAETTAISAIENCFVFSGDAGVTAFDPYVEYQWTNVTSITGNNGCFLVNFWPSLPTGRKITADDCTAVHLGPADSGEYGPPVGPGPFPYLGLMGAVVYWSDGRNDHPTWGRFDVTFNHLEVHGPLAGRAFAIHNAPYPSAAWGAYTQDQAGKTANWKFNGLWCEETPGQRAILQGRDLHNTPCNFEFDDVFIGGVEVSTANWDVYVDMNEPPYWIFIGGREVVTAVDIVNLALANIGQSARVTSIAPLDGSAEAELASLRYSQEVNKLLMRHKWAFATRSHLLVAVTNGATSRWTYCYALPASFLALQAVLPPGVTESGRGLTQAQFAVEQDAVGVQRLYTNMEVETLVFTSTVTNPNLFTPQFIDLLSWSLAAVFAGSLIKGEPGFAVTRKALEMVEFILRTARETDAELRNVEAAKPASYLEARQ